MNGNILTSLRTALTDQRGQVLPWMVFGMIGFMGVAGMAIDVGHAYVVHSQLIGSTNAAALAGAEALPNISASSLSAAQAAASSAAAAYGSGSGGANANSSFGTVNVTSTVWCSNTLLAMGIPCSGSANANIIRVTQTASVPTTFLSVLGVKQLTVSTTSTAARAKPVRYNVALIVDTTLSMNSQDSNCGSTQMNCALTGVQQMLSSITPSMDPVALFTFPNVRANTASIDSNCTTPISGSSFPYQNGYGYISMLPVSPWNGYSGDSTGWSKVATAMPYTFPPIGGTSYGPSGTVPTYLVVPFSKDYRTSDTGGLSTTSSLVKAAGGVSGCNGMTTANNDGDYGTYYAGAIYAAQAALLAEQPNNPNSENVMIILGDGDSTAPNSSSSPDSASASMPSTAAQATQSYTSNSYTFPSNYLLANSSASYPSWQGECGQAVDAADYVATYPNNPTKVFSVAYGASTSGCLSDQSPNTSSHQGISPCETMREMASQSAYYYSDYNATGGDPGCVSNQPITALNDIFKSIAANLTGARLIPNNTQ
jgi:hypothetical protein